MLSTASATSPTSPSPKSLAKRLMPRSILLVLRDMLRRADHRLAVACAKSGMLSSLYYTFISREFRREHRAVLSGRVEYWRALKHVDESCALLRRNIHRLEKGLIMEPRRPVFALDFLEETVTCYRDAVKSTSLCESERKWATDVLIEYFRVVGDHPVTNRERERFFDCVHGDAGDGKFIPYPFKELPPIDITYDQLEVLFKHRRSVRFFQERAVAMEDLRKAVDIAALAPSACNRQPFKFYIAAEPGKAAKLAKIAMGTKGYAENVPCLISIVGELDAYPYERDRHVIYIDGALVSMQLMLALETLGLSTCAINWPDIDYHENKMAAALGLKPHQRVIMLMAVGYAKLEGGIPYSQKKKSDTLIKVVDH